MALDWTKPLRTKGGAFAMLLPSVGHDPRRRVAQARDGSKPSPVPGEWRKPGREVTVWLYPEDGISRCDRQPSDMDLVNA